MNIKVQVPTPDDKVLEILDLAGYKNNLYGKTVLENSCGEGNFLVRIVERYIEDCKKKKIAKSDIKIGLERDIAAFETDEEKIKICIDRLNQVTNYFKINDVKWSIECADYLKDKTDKTYDYIIGNPPYCTYHDLSEEERAFLRSNFDTCKSGRFDYFYAFIEKSLRMLNKGGKLYFLVPFSLYRNKSAEYLRKSILKDLIMIVDYSGINVFENVTVSSTVIGCCKDGNTLDFRYIKPIEKKDIGSFKKKDLGDLWIFDSTNHKRIRFGDLFSVRNSVATQCNEAFLIIATEEDDKYVYTDQGEKLEQALIKKAASIRSATKDLRIIYPYLCENNEIKHLSEEELESEYPLTFKHLKKYKSKLLMRDATRGAKWFEYGRSQGLQHICNSNIIISMVITNKVKTIETEKDVVPYAGYVVTARSNQKLDIARQILESPDFLIYVKGHGTPTTRTSYRISCKEIENYTIESI